MHLFIDSFLIYRTKVILLFYSENVKSFIITSFPVLHNIQTNLNVQIIQTIAIPLLLSRDPATSIPIFLFNEGDVLNDWSSASF